MKCEILKYMRFRYLKPSQGTRLVIFTGLHNLIVIFGVTIFGFGKSEALLIKREYFLTFL